MAKKTGKVITGIGRDPENKLTVQKSHTLAALWQSDLSLAEFKILDMYLARIDSSASEQRTVQLTKGELERALGVTQIKKDDLKARLANLFVPIDLATKKNAIKLRALFDAADAEQDSDGIWQIELRCTEDAADYIFNVDRIGYFRYKLRSVIGLTSRYSYLLFNYLEDNRFRNPWTVELKELKKVLNCDKDESYKEFKIFNNRILKKCQNELAEKTECKFTYETIRKGRSVASIKFHLTPLSPQITEVPKKKDVDPNQATIFDYEDRVRRGKICCGFDDSAFDEFKDEELIEFRGLAWDKVDPEAVRSQFETLHDHRMARENAVTQFIHLKIQAMNVYDKRDPIKDRYSYLKKALGGK